MMISQQQRCGGSQSFLNNLLLRILPVTWAETGVKRNGHVCFWIHLTKPDGIYASYPMVSRRISGVYEEKRPSVGEGAQPGLLGRCCLIAHFWKTEDSACSILQIEVYMISLSLVGRSQYLFRGSHIRPASHGLDQIWCGRFRAAEGTIEAVPAEQ